MARYLLPMYPALTIVSSHTLTNLCGKLNSRITLASKLPAFVIALCLTVPIAVSIKAIRSLEIVPFFTGNHSRRTFLSKLNYYGPMDFVNRMVPSNAKVLSIGEQMCYHLKPDYLSDQSWDSTEWRRVLSRNSSWEEMNNDLKRQGVTHVIFSPSLFEFIARIGRQGTGGAQYLSSSPKLTAGDPQMIPTDYEVFRNWVTFDHYRAKNLETIYRDNEGFEVLKLK